MTLTNNETAVLRVLKAKNGLIVNAKVLKAETGLSDTDLQTAASGLTRLECAKFEEPMELAVRR